MAVLLHPLRANVHVTFKGLAAKQFIPNVEIHLSQNTTQTVKDRELEDLLKN